MVSFTKKQKKQFRQARRAALGISKGAVTAGKLASAAGATGVGKKLQAGGRAGRAAARGQGAKAAKHVGTLSR